MMELTEKKLEEIQKSIYKGLFTSSLDQLEGFLSALTPKSELYPRVLYLKSLLFLEKSEYKDAKSTAEVLLEFSKNRNLFLNEIDAISVLVQATTPLGKMDSTKIHIIRGSHLLKKHVSNIKDKLKHYYY